MVVTVQLNMRQITLIRIALMQRVIALKALKHPSDVKASIEDSEALVDMLHKARCEEIGKRGGPALREMARTVFD